MKKNRTRYFDLFSSASNLRGLQATYLKFAEYVDILEQIVYEKFKYCREKDSWVYRVQGNWKTIFFRFPKVISAACISLLCYSTTGLEFNLKLVGSLTKSGGQEIIAIKSHNVTLFNKFV